MTAVKISGTFSKDSRPDNGLEAIAEKLSTDEFARHVVVGVLELHKVVKEVGEEPVPTVRFVAVEPIEDRDAAMKLLNKARKARGQSPLSGTLFDPTSDDEQDGDGDQGRRRARAGLASVMQCVPESWECDNCHDDPPPFHICPRCGRAGPGLDEPTTAEIVAEKRADDQ